ncbi:DUF3793 family protein [uncultured Phascolarctobacterium sp.]|uniref:DUF3793 family protein n=1 Tax=uncultured Phascolarctobacterium sp. TaxID=512296 RepID=UPI0027D9A540|nr:DUF3793 family protein [uncultured Phascolarctobacterium sp.]
MQFELHGFKSFDELLAFHCAPALAGIKPANLVSCPTVSMPVVAPLLTVYTEQFADRGIAFEVLCHCTARTLILVYQPRQLEALLQKHEVSCYLKELGYKTDSVHSLLRQLGSRVSCSNDFPHEIGIFLGYPLADIKGFIENKGQNCKCSGYWKVYDDVEHARCLFDAYNKCRDRLLKAVAEGVPLHLAAAFF